MSRSADPGFLVTLSRLELLRLRAFWRFASRDIVFDVCVVAGIAMLYGTARRGFDVAAAAPAPARLALAFGLGVLLLLSAHAGPGSRARERLVSGPFHALVSDPGRMALWMSLRALGFALLGCLLASLVIATIDPLAALEFLGLSAAGAATAAVLASLRREPQAKDRRERAASAGRFWTLLVVRSPVAMIAICASRAGPVPGGLIAIGVLALGGLAGRLAAQNNNAPQIGATICAVAAMLAGLVLFPRGRLPGLLGQEPPRLWTIFFWLYAAPLAVAAVGGPLAALICGLGGASAVEVGLSAGTGVAIVAWFAFLHRLIRSERYAALGAGLEFAAALFMSTIDASLGPFWLAARGLILVRAAGRRRWLDR